MIKSVTVTNHLNESITLELRASEKSGFLIKEIEGLGPAKANINTSDISTGDGSLYNSAKVNARNIVFTLKLLDSPTIEDTRQKSYKYFPIKRRIKLLFETDNRICEIYGYVESNEPDIFSSQETTKISIICPNPYLYSSGDDGLTITVFSGFEPVFEFPFSNESTTEKLIEVGNILTNQMQNIYYDGDAEIGIDIKIHAVGTALNILIYNMLTDETMTINTVRLVALTGSVVIAGDDIFISTVRGSKSATLLRNGVYTNILNCLDKDVDWFTLSKGDNVFSFTAEEGGSNLHFTIWNQTLYEGV